MWPLACEGAGDPHPRVPPTRYITFRNREIAMNVFVLSTGRCGSLTFIRACNHITNFTAGHETRPKMLGEERLAYPENHIEADNRLSWFLGRLERKYGNSALYVHLQRDPEAVAGSLNRRWMANQSIAAAYRDAILKMSDEARLACCRDYVDTVTENILLFLRDKPRQMTIWLETVKNDFPDFWAQIDANGDLHAALAEWNICHHSSANKPPRPYRSVLRRGVRAYRAAFPRP
jgi:hypothetical protein